eukprot:CAMPEP_0183304132 /NCGR_PEP_ID=MMETSP0160_2-20130417/9331_1 /TAXON_ID=2839 ORGANISM="Odontella Sinensis, Strain Grunow 1884" /NCGR_SAMPLE_ID=MMETSP0160_2 /ASSEMBLY_ACC=CAM_ASM_000250 /LENGTH=106 /DNA_ID=CAMNT_0025467133 /DNA_START=203 /DNA_END=520 /DNA_ORIENTATION=+
MTLPRPSALISALIEKFLPEAAARRRVEAERELRERFIITRSILVQVAATPSGSFNVVVEVEGQSRCPMHQGRKLPICFYATRADVGFSEGWWPRVVAKTDPAPLW